MDRPGNFVEPTLIKIGKGASVVSKEAFVPISYIMEYEDLNEAIKANNSVSQGLSAALFTNNVITIFKFLMDAKNANKRKIFSVAISLNG